MYNNKEVNKIKELFETIPPKQKYEMVFMSYEIGLVVAEINTEAQHFKQVDLGTYKVTMPKGTGNFTLIAKAKELYPELTKYRNIQLTSKAMTKVKVEIGLDKLNELIVK